VGYFTQTPVQEEHRYPLNSGHYNKVCLTANWNKAWLDFNKEAKRRRGEGVDCPWKLALSSMEKPLDEDSSTPKQICKSKLYYLKDAYSHRCAHRQYGTTGDLVLTPTTI
jgi:hypothetical protein